jgi:hypothetical protein
VSNTIHIVCLDSPSPPDYGGAIDMFYKVKALKETGRDIILHYFDYNTARDISEVRKFCVEVYAYKRKLFLTSRPLSRPFITESRINHALIRRLNQDNYPVLLEGLHCSGIVPFLQDKERVVLRMHNEEASYYAHLAKAETSILKRLYFLQESRLLASYQNRLDKNIQLACLSEEDMNRLENTYSFHRLSFVPCFIPWQEVRSLEGRGDYCLYHGNLSVSENEEAVLWLIRNVFSRVAIPFVVAGSRISKRLVTQAKKHPHIMLVNNPPDDELQALVRDAQIHVLPSLNSTGVKLKLLNALLNGRFCLTNSNGVKGSRIDKGVLVQSDASEWISTLTDYMQRDFSTPDREERNAILSLYNNRKNAQTLNALWRHYR